MSQQILPGELSQIDTVARFPLGALYVDHLGNHYRYLQADGAVTAKNLYSYNLSTGQILDPIDVGVTPADTNSVPVCVWEQSDTALADNEYAWCFTGPGVFTTTTAGSIAAGAICYGHATAGLIDDAATAVLLKGVTCVAAITGATTGSFQAALPLHAEDLP